MLHFKDSHYTPPTPTPCKPLEKKISTVLKNIQHLIVLFNSAEALLIGDQWRLSARQSSKSDTSYGYPASYFTRKQTVSPVGLLL